MPCGRLLFACCGYWQMDRLLNAVAKEMFFCGFSLVYCGEACACGGGNVCASRNFLSEAL